MNSDRPNLQNSLLNHLLWPFRNLPENYVVLDTETTGLFDEDGAPGIVTIGVVEVSNGKSVKANEYAVRPHRQMTNEASQINGISDQQAQSFPTFTSKWPEIRADLTGRLVVIHNAIFDWPLLIEHVVRYGVDEPSILGVFCSQRAAQPWAKAMGLKCSDRGPSLDTLTEAMGVNSFRSELDGIHSASMDAKQTAEVVEALRRYQ
ncbi:MAG: 3'-5' exonuclease [gamma proteobacterium symbiont of Clathrolucina costata]